MSLHHDATRMEEDRVAGASTERKNPGGLSNNSVGATLTKTNEQVWDRSGEEGGGGGVGRVNEPFIARLCLFSLPF